MKLPTLYKEAKTGATQEWSIEITVDGAYRTIAGQVGGQLTASDYTHCNPKNIGRTNATTNQEQALAEAKAKWQKKKDHGYVEDMKTIGKVSYFEPMLAHNYNDYKDKIEFPVFSQPKLDGCVVGNTKILTEHNGLLPIRKIVKERIEDRVFCFNEQTNKEEFKPILNWFNNGTSTDNKKWFEIKTRHKTRIKCTTNHKFFTNHGWIEAKDLNESEHKIFFQEKEIRLTNLIAGTLLGDACLVIDKRHSGQSFRLVFGHVNKDLFEYKKELLGIAGKSNKKISGYNSTLNEFISTSLTKTSFPINDFYYTGHHPLCGKRKIISYKKLKKYITAESLSLWIADDGSLRFNNKNKYTPVLSISTHCFDQSQLDEFLKYFQNVWNCSPSLIKDKQVKKNGWFLNFNTKDTLYLLNQLTKLHCKGVEYKYYFETRGYILPCNNKTNFVTFKKQISRKTYQLEKFDLEVQDNHNYFANNILIHNCRAITTKDGIFSRNGKPIVSCPHIFESLKPYLDKEPNLVFDGELYNHSLCNDFNKLMSLIKKLKPTKEDLEESAKLVEYWVYDLPSKIKFGSRFFLFQPYKKYSVKCVRYVYTSFINNQQELDEKYEGYLTDGFEGQIIRLNEPYQNKRTKFLLKRKEMMDAEFEIVDIIEGVGNKSGQAATAFVKNLKGQIFKPNVKGTWEFCTKLLKEKDEVIGKMGTVQFQNYTPDGDLRFPYIISIRDYE